ncbi:TIGR02679 family protein [Sorangium sp. So ce1000]|uniref:TIGR02679 family protein n=1 Tax=Sorangium sp. So ce1000 TaxID=3133325 RepID=UPI003F6268A2
MSSIDPRLLRLLGGEHLASLRRRLRQRFERAPCDEAVERIRIDRLTADEHAALAALQGRSQRFSSSLRVDVRLVDGALQRAGIAASLHDALERLDGPIVHLAAARSRLQSQWSDVVSGCRHAGLVRWLESPANLGLLKRLASGDPSTGGQLCRHAEAVLRRLPARGMTRSQLAAEVLGDAHALDSGRAAATLALAVFRQVASPARDDDDGEALADLSNGDGPRRAVVDERARDTWARAGVLVNELARPALFLNLPTRGGESCGRTPGEPAYASLRSLVRNPPSWAVEGRDVYVCENPNLVAIAADHWGARCAPLVCTDGVPAAAQRTLLSQLTQAGARLRCHADFDWAGLAIGNCLMREHGALPWRFGADDYAAAARAAPRPGRPLRGVEIEASWDAALAAVMRTHGLTIDEEAVAASLLLDLSPRGASHGLTAEPGSM